MLASTDQCPHHGLVRHAAVSMIGAAGAHAEQSSPRFELGEGLRRDMIPSGVRALQEREPPAKPERLTVALLVGMIYKLLNAFPYS